MVNIEKVSYQILNDGLYNTLLFEIKESVPTQNITPRTMQRLLRENPSFIKEYKEINRQSEISNIHVKKLVVKKEDDIYALHAKKEINERVQLLKNLENFETDSKNSAYAIWIGSVGVSVLFMIHNIIALFSELYTTHASFVYMFFMLTLVLTYISYIKIKKNHDKQHVAFQKVYIKTKEMIEDGFKHSYFTYIEVYET